MSYSVIFQQQVYTNSQSRAAALSITSNIHHNTHHFYGGNQVLLPVLHVQLSVNHSHPHVASEHFQLLFLSKCAFTYSLHTQVVLLRTSGLHSLCFAKISLSVCTEK